VGPTGVLRSHLVEFSTDGHADENLNRVRCLQGFCNGPFKTGLHTKTPPSTTNPSIPVLFPTNSSKWTHYKLKNSFAATERHLSNGAPVALRVAKFWCCLSSCASSTPPPANQVCFLSHRLACCCSYQSKNRFWVAKYENEGSKA
jgi:hypothetical protein